MNNKQYLTKLIEKAKKEKWEEKYIMAIKKFRITKDGRVFNRKRGNELKPYYDGIRYPNIGVYMGNGISKRVNIHRLMAYIYIPNPEKLPQVNHKDGNHTNNNIKNLEWCTAAYNVSDGFERGRVVWQAGKVSKRRVLGYCKKYPRQLFWILSENNFKFAKAIWGEELKWSNPNGTGYVGDKGICLGVAWQHHLKRLALSEGRIKYLKENVKL